MCENAPETVGLILAELEPDVKGILTVVGIANTADAQAALTAYNALATDLQGYKPGDDISIAVEAINTFTDVFDTLPLPDEAKGLAEDIDAALVILLGILKGNSTTDKNEQKKIADETFAAAQKKKPGLHVSVWDRAKAFVTQDHTFAAHEIRNQWNKDVEAVAKVDTKYAVLKTA